MYMKSGRSSENAKNPKAYLGRMAVNQSIDRLHELKKQRETIQDPGCPSLSSPWILIRLPPLNMACCSCSSGSILQKEQCLSFVKVFLEEYDQIAELTDLSVENCRQLLHRAQKS